MSPSLEQEKILIIGVGNEFRSDDAVGLITARRLRDQGRDLFNVLEQTGEGTSLIEAWRGVGSVIVVDAVVSGAAPGTIHRFEANAKALPKRFFGYSTHAFNLAEAIELARALGELPTRLVVYGIEAINFEAGVGLTASVDEASRRVEKQILSEN